MSNNKVTERVNRHDKYFYDIYEIVFRINYIKKISINEKKIVFLMSENRLRKLFRINEIRILMSVTGLHQVHKTK